MSGVFRSPAGEAKVMAMYRDVLDRWPVPHEETTIDTAQGSTFVVSCGPPEAPPVVLLHGSQANSAAWLPDVPTWSRNFRLHAVDMIGEAGFSERVRPPLDGDTHAGWLQEVMGGLGVARAAFVGTSLGGWLALDHAVCRPQAVSALALICPAGIGRQKNFLLAAAPWLLLGAYGKRRIRNMVFGPQPETLPEELALISPLMNAIGEAIRPRVARIPQLTDSELSELTMPLLAILGGRDAILDSRDTCARLEANVSQAELRFIEDGYHFLPDQSEPVRMFLKRSIAVTE